MRGPTDSCAADGLQTIPGVGRSIAVDLRVLGYKKVGDLKGQDPQKMYERSCKKAGVAIDRCLLYRCAVYYASRKKYDPQKLKWWHWKD